MRIHHRYDIVMQSRRVRGCVGRAPRVLQVLLTSGAMAAFGLSLSPMARADSRTGPRDESSAVAPSPPADAASEADTKAVARRHYLRGVQLYKDGDFKLSIVEFRRAYDVSHNFRVLYNIARVNQQLNNYVLALQAFEQYLRDGNTSVSNDRRDEVEREMFDLRSKTAHVEIVVSVDDAEVILDGVSMGKSPMSGALLVDAGDHQIEVHRAGYQSARRPVTLAGRDTTRVDVKLIETKPIVAAAPSARPAVVVERKTPGIVWAGWTATGALAIGAGILGGLAASRAHELETLQNSPDSTADGRAAMKSQARSFAIATDVVAATALAAAGTTLFLTLRSGSTKLSQPVPTLQAGLCGTTVCLTQRY